MKRYLLLLILLPLLALTCDDGTDTVHIGKIERIEVEPNPVVAGDTARFTCVFAQYYSGDAPIEYFWIIQDQANFSTTENQVEWVAPRTPGIYDHHVGVSVVDPGQSVSNTGKGFTVEVVAE